MKILDYDSEKRWEYENGFYLTSDATRVGKLISHWELYKRIVDLPGDVVECGVFKGVSLVQLATFRNMLENPYSRKIVGFDIFGKFPGTDFEADKSFRADFINAAGEESIKTEELTSIFNYKKLDNFELVKGDINQTVPAYVKANPQLKISLLHIDTDIYEPAKTILEHLYERVVKGGIIIFDDYGAFPGETKAVDEFFQGKKNLIKKLPISHKIPSYLIKED